jgi:hypothetical protein
MMVFIFSFFFPFLLVLAVVQTIARRAGLALTCVGTSLYLMGLAIVVVCIPVKGVALGRWIVSINANYSIPLTALALSKVWENGTGRVLLDARSLLVGWWFGCACALALYPMALGLTGCDPYAAGWSFSWLFGFLLVLTIVLLISKNRFAYVLMGCILCFNLQLLESTNLWDYLVDPIFATVSTATLVGRAIRKIICCSPQPAGRD